MSPKQEQDSPDRREDSVSARLKAYMSNYLSHPDSASVSKGSPLQADATPDAGVNDYGSTPLSTGVEDEPPIVLPRTSEEAQQGLYIEQTGGATVGYMPDRSGYRPHGEKSGTPFAACTQDGTFVAGDVNGKGGPPSLEAVRGAAREAFQDTASFNPSNGGDMTRVQETLSRELKDPAARLSGIMAIQNDSRCAPKP